MIKSFHTALALLMAGLTTMLVSTTPVQAAPLNWNEIQECIYIRSDIEQVRIEQALDRQARNLVPLMAEFQRECVKGRWVAEQDFNVVCSIEANYDSLYCVYLRERFALHGKSAKK